jgi:sugar phosphate isomerase/epimerase
MLSRREFTSLALAAPLAGAAKVKSVVNGVMLGAQSYSFRDRSLDEAIKGYQDVGLQYVEMYSGHIEPRNAPREEIRKWRTSVPLKEIEAVRKKFDNAGLTLYAFNYSFRDDFTDEEIARGFEIAKALGVKRITASSNVTTAKRVDPFAKKAQILVGMHNHSNIKPNEFARPDDFAEAMSGTSDYIVINLDIGHFTAAGFDAVDYLDKHHAKIVTLHIKDRKKNQGPNVPFGEGDTPIKAVLQLLKTKKLKIPAMIEYEYKGADTIAEMKKCADYCKNALA